MHLQSHLCRVPLEIDCTYCLRFLSKLFSFILQDLYCACCALYYAPFLRHELQTGVLSVYPVSLFSLIHFLLGVVAIYVVNLSTAVSYQWISSENFHEIVRYLSQSGPRESA